MMIVRDVFQAKYGKGGDLVALLKESAAAMPQMAVYRRILTDASGPFFTVVAEAEVGSLAEWEKLLAQVFSDPDFSQWFGQMVPLVDSGRREFYNIE